MLLGKYGTHEASAAVKGASVKANIVGIAASSEGIPSPQRLEGRLFYGREIR